MNYKMSINKLKECRYPNLMAEFIESHYSICTVSDYMGYGEREEDDSFIWYKLLGKEELNLDESIALTKLFQVNANYLFSKELSMVGGSTFAFIRHYESNRKREEELRYNTLLGDLKKAINKTPILADFVEMVLALEEKQIRILVESMMLPEAA